MLLQKEQATAATKKVKDGMTNFLGGISKVLTIPPDDEYQPLVKTATGVEPIYDRSKVRGLSVPENSCVFIIELRTGAVTRAATTQCLTVRYGSLIQSWSLF